MRKTLSATLVALSLGVGGQELPADDACFTCEDWYFEQTDEWWHHDDFMGDAERKGIFHEFDSPFSCASHRSYNEELELPLSVKIE